MNKILKCLFLISTIILFTCNMNFTSIGIRSDDQDLYEIMIKDPKNQYSKPINSVELLDSFYVRKAQLGETFYYYELRSESAGGLPSPDKGSYHTETIKDSNVSIIDSLIYSCNRLNDSIYTGCATMPIKLDNGTVTYTISSIPGCNQSRKVKIINSEIGILYKAESCYSGMDGHSSHTVLIKHNGKDINIASILNEYYAKREIVLNNYR